MWSLKTELTYAIERDVKGVGGRSLNDGALSLFLCVCVSAFFNNFMNFRWL